MKKIICIIILLLFINPITVFSAKKGWYQDEMNNWYFIDYQSGNKKYGWIADGAYWYYLDSQKGIMQTGWQSIDEKCYYFTGNGRMVIGNYLIDDVYYHFAKDGHLTGIIEQKRYSGYQKVDTLIESILEEMKLSCQNEQELLQTIYDYCTSHFTIGMDSLISETIDLGELDSQFKYIPMAGLLNHSRLYYTYAFQTLNNKSGSATGIAIAFNVLAEAKGFKTSLLSGTINGEEIMLPLVWYENEWQLIDVYHDILNQENQGFLVSNKEDKFKAEYAFFDYYDSRDIFHQYTDYMWNKDSYYQKFASKEDYYEIYTQNDSN